jgi:hypothetical protein
VANLLRAVGLLVMGGVIGEAVSRLTVGGTLLLVIVGVAGLLIFVAGWYLAERRTRAGATLAAARVRRLGKAITKGLDILDGVAAWSNANWYAGPSTPDTDPALTGAMSVEKDARLRQMVDWGKETEQLVEDEFGLEALAFHDAPPRMPVVYIHDHLYSVWSEARGRVAWLMERIGRPG